MTIDMGDLALLILFVLCLAIFVYLLIKVLKGRAIRIDEVGYLLLVERLRSPVLTAAMKAVSSLASLPFVVGVLAAAMLWAPNWAHVVWAAFNVGAISAIDQLLKVLVRRPRPQGFRLVEAPGLSLWLWHMVGAVWRVWPSVRRRHRGCTRVCHPCGGRQPCLSGRALRFGCAGRVLPVFCLAHPVRASWPLDFDRLIVVTGRHVGSNLILTQP